MGIGLEIIQERINEVAKMSKKCGYGGMISTTDVINDNTFLDYYYRLIELAVDRYSWINLPITVDERFLELTLICDGMAVFFYDDILGYLALQVRIGGPLNVYRIPIRRTAYSVSGYQNSLSIEDSVIIFNNYLRQPSLFTINNYAYRLYDLQRTLDVNIKAQKTPYFLQTTQQQQLTLRNIYKQYDGNEPVIFADKNFDMSTIKVFPTETPFIADKTYQLKMQTWNEALAYLGYENIGDNKKERYITNEVNAMMGAVDAQRFSGLNARKQACKLINNMFGLNIDVEFRQKRMVEKSNVEIHDNGTMAN